MDKSKSLHWIVEVNAVNVDQYKMSNLYTVFLHKPFGLNLSSNEKGTYVNRVKPGGNAEEWNLKQQSIQGADSIGML